MNLSEMGKIADGLNHRAFIRELNAINSQNKLTEIDQEALAEKFKVVATSLQPKIQPDCRTTSVEGLNASKHTNTVEMKLENIKNICYDYNSGRKIR